MYQREDLYASRCLASGEAERKTGRGYFKKEGGGKKNVSNKSKTSNKRTRLISFFFRIVVLARRHDSCARRKTNKGNSGDGDLR